MKKTLAILVSSTHWDREWYWPLERFRFHLVDVMDDVLDTLSNDDGFHSFTFDGQSIVIEDYLEIRPERRKQLEEFVGNGRLLFGPWYVQPDEFLVSGESLVRNFERGIAVARAVGGWLPLGYTPDMFGHVPQLPQLLRLLGMDKAIMTRGLGRQLDDKPVRTEFVWEGLDGSSVRVLFQLHGYGNAAKLGMPHDRQVAFKGEASGPLARDTLEKEVADLSPLSPNGVVLLNNGTDHVTVQSDVTRLLSFVNENSTAIEVRHGSYADYLDAVPFEPEKLAVLRGELRGAEHYPLLPGVFSARTYLKLMNAECESLLTAYAEPLWTLAAPAAARSLDAFLDLAWGLLLQNHPHDSICGCSVDEVHREMEVRFEKVAQIGREVVVRCAEIIGAGSGRDPGGPVAVFNATGWNVPWPVETPLDATEMEPFVHHPHKGCGVELVAPTQPGDPAVDGLVVRKDGVENRFFDLSYRTAPVPGLWYTDKASGRQLGPLNRFHSFADAGDEYEFQTLDSDDDPLGGQGSVELRAVKQHHGYATLQLQEIITVPRGLTRDRKDRAAGLVPVKFDSTVTVFADHPVVNITTTVVNTVKDHKVAALFKLPGKPTALRCGAQFGEVERPVSDQVEEYAIESVPPWHPFREYVASPEAGFALFARGLLEYGTPAAGDDLSLALTLWRSVEWLSRPQSSANQGALCLK